MIVIIIIPFHFAYNVMLDWSVINVIKRKRNVSTS